MMANQNMFLPNRRYAVAVSGGIDSMVLLHMMACDKNLNIFAVTVNHGIRPEAQSDCDFVADYCKRLGVECRVFRVDVPAYAAENKLSTETAARLLRYRVLDELDCDFVCLAHNADDNAETVLMHILRGSGARGATGMQRVNGRYLRPLLDWTRERIERYADEHNVPHVEDSTNADTNYTRNFIRHKVMPLLGQLNPAVRQNILRFAQNIGRDDERLNAQAQENLQQVLFDDDGAHIPTALLAQDDYRLAEMVFSRLGVHHDIEQKHYFALFDLARNDGGKSVNLPFGYTAFNDYDFVTICPEHRRKVYRFEIPFAVGATVTPLGVATVTETPLPNALFADVSKIPQGAVFRTRRQGDVFTKFGGGSKPLNRYLIDKKIPERKRNELLLVAKGNEVFAIMGVEICEKLRVEEGTTPYYIKLEQTP